MLFIYALIFGGSVTFDRSGNMKTSGDTSRIKISGARINGKEVWLNDTPKTSSSTTRTSSSSNTGAIVAGVLGVGVLVATVLYAINNKKKSPISTFPNQKILNENTSFSKTKEKTVNGAFEGSTPKKKQSS